METSKLSLILASHKLWIESNGMQGERASLRGAYLKDANLGGANLRDASLRVANLRDASLEGAVLA